MYAQKNDTFSEVDFKNWRKDYAFGVYKMQLLLGVEGITGGKPERIRRPSEPSGQK